MMATGSSRALCLVNAMPKPDRDHVCRLEDLPNIGKAAAADLRLLDIQKPEQLMGRDAFALYRQLCERTGSRHDPCVIDVFLSAISFMETGVSRPWWDFSAQRKQMLAGRRD